MAGLSRYETLILGAAAAFLLFAGGWFLGSRNLAQPYEVTTLGGGESSSAAESEPEDKSWPDSLLEGERIDLNRADAYDLARRRASAKNGHRPLWNTGKPRAPSGVWRS